MIKRFNVMQEERHQLLLLVQDIRQDHPTMGVRDIYYKLNPAHIGRDAFERLCRNWDLMIKKERNYSRTTDSSGVVRFDNLIENLTLTHIDQVWQSDITYYLLHGKFYYLTFILDAFSRRILGCRASKRLYTEDTTLPALQQAIAARKNTILKGLIFHSDGGGQYYDDKFLQLTKKYAMKNSMCEYAWENGKAERINGVIKNNYLKYRKINSYADLIKELDRSVQLYNKEKPHIALQRKSPVTFENEILHLHQQTKLKMTKSLNANNQILGASSPKKSEQTQLQNQNV